MTAVCYRIWGDASDELFRMQGIYSYSMAATSVSCICSNAFLVTYMKTEDEQRNVNRLIRLQKEIVRLHLNDGMPDAEKLYE